MIVRHLSEDNLRDNTNDNNYYDALLVQNQVKVKYMFLPNGYTIPFVQIHYKYTCPFTYSVTISYTHA